MKQFEAKDPSEKVILTFDLSSDLAVGETLTGTPTASIVCWSGVDPSPIGMFNGSASLDVSSTMVLVPVQGGVEDCLYWVKVVSSTSNAQKVLALSGLLPVRQ